MFDLVVGDVVNRNQVVSFSYFVGGDKKFSLMNFRNCESHFGKN